MYQCIIVVWTQGDATFLQSATLSLIPQLTQLSLGRTRSHNEVHWTRNQLKLLSFSPHEKAWENQTAIEFFTPPFQDEA